MPFAQNSCFGLPKPRCNRASASGGSSASTEKAGFETSRTNPSSVSGVVAQREQHRDGHGPTTSAQSARWYRGVPFSRQLVEEFGDLFIRDFGRPARGLKHANTIALGGLKGAFDTPSHERTDRLAERDLVACCMRLRRFERIILNLQCRSSHISIITC